LANPSIISGGKKEAYESDGSNKKAKRGLMMRVFFMILGING
jgi:hypothetical protein